MSDSKELTRYVHEGEVLQPIGNIKITIRVDTAALRRALRAVKIAQAIPMLRPMYIDERNVIDQEPQP